MLQYRAESRILRNPQDAMLDWLSLEARADCSWFLSWGWVGTWLEQVVSDLDPVLVRVLQGDKLVGLSIYVPREIKRRYVFHASALFLNEYPFDNRNMVIEYNGILAARGHEAMVYSATLRHLCQVFPQKDEFYFGAIAEGPDLDCLSMAAKGLATLQVYDTSTAWQVDLEAFETGLAAFLATLSKNRRGQIRRSIRGYEAQGPLALEEAQNSTQALIYFDGLKELHTARRRAKGDNGAFANPLWERYHRELIRGRFEAGEIQMIKVSNPVKTLGYLYNFVFRRQIYVMQTGFALAEDNRDLPGYVVHALAIVHNQEKGMMRYDLMHGDALYKKILCNRSRKLFWAVLQRRRLRFGVERMAVDVVRLCRRLGRRGGVVV